MSKYLPVIEFTTTFQDDTVKVTLEPIDRATFVKVLPTFQQAQRDQAADDRFNKIYGTACEVLSTHMKSIVGLRDVNGTAISLETVLSKMYFSKLVSEIFMRLMAEATLEGKGSSSSEAS